MQRFVSLQINELHIIAPANSKEGKETKMLGETHIKTDLCPNDPGKSPRDAAMRKVEAVEQLRAKSPRRWRYPNVLK